MKNNLFFVAIDYELAKNTAIKVAEFFAMRLFDSVEMFEFDHTPRKINEVLNDFGIDYVKKEMKSVVRMSLDFDEVVSVADFDYLDCWKELFKKIQQKYLVIFLSDINNENLTQIEKLNKMNFLTNCCDLAIDVKNLPDEKIFDKIINEIKTYFNCEV